MGRVRAHLFISGRVQGVFFRRNTCQQARILAVNGFVRNLPDGRVEAVFEGEKERVEKMIAWCRKGPTLSRVDKVEVFWEKCGEKFENFEIK